MIENIEIKEISFNSIFAVGMCFDNPSNAQKFAYKLLDDSKAIYEIGEEKFLPIAYSKKGSYSIERDLLINTFLEWLKEEELPRVELAKIEVMLTNDKNENHLKNCIFFIDVLNAIGITYSTKSGYYYFPTVYENSNHKGCFFKMNCVPLNKFGIDALVTQKYRQDFIDPFVLDEKILPVAIGLKQINTLRKELKSKRIEIQNVSDLIEKSA